MTAEFIEEHTILTKRVLKYAIGSIFSLRIALWILEVKLYFLIGLVSCNDYSILTGISSPEYTYWPSVIGFILHDFDEEFPFHRAY